MNNGKVEEDYNGGRSVNDLVNFGTLFYDGVMDLTPFKAKRPSDREGRASIAGFDENDTTLRGIVQTAQRLGKLVDLSKFREKFGERRRKKAGKGESLGSRVKVIPEGFSEDSLRIPERLWQSFQRIHPRILLWIPMGIPVWIPTGRGADYSS